MHSLSSITPLCVLLLLIVECYYVTYASQASVLPIFQTNVDFGSSAEDGSRGSELVIMEGEEPIDVIHPFCEGNSAEAGIMMACRYISLSSMTKECIKITVITVIFLMHLSGNNFFVLFVIQQLPADIQSHAQEQYHVCIPSVLLHLRVRI